LFWGGGDGRGGEQRSRGAGESRRAGRGRRAGRRKEKEKNGPVKKRREKRGDRGEEG